MASTTQGHGAASGAPAAAAVAPANVMFTADAPGIIEHMNSSIAFTPFDVKWVPESARFVLLGTKPNDAGIIQVYEMGACRGMMRSLHPRL